MEETEKENSQINIYPLSRGKRILSYLADMFINFIFAVILFNLLVYPISTAIYGYKPKYEAYMQAQNDRDSVLYDNSLLLSESGERDFDHYNENLEYTFDTFACFYVTGSAPSTFNPDVFATYAEDIKDDHDLYISLYSNNDPKGKFFDLSGGNPVMQPFYAAEFEPKFTPGDSMSSKGEKDYKDFLNNFFLPAYRDMLQHINKNGLSYGDKEYSELQKQVTSFLAEYDALEVGDVMIAFVLSSSICFLLIPLINKNRKTLAMILLKGERLDMRRMDLLSRGRQALLFPYQFALNAVPIVFTCWGVSSFNELFSLPVLFILSGISFVLLLASLIFMLVDPYNRTLMDRLTSTVMISTESLDEIYRGKGYSI